MIGVLVAFAVSMIGALGTGAALWTAGTSDYNEGGNDR